MSPRAWAIWCWGHNYSGVLGSDSCDSGVDLPCATDTPPGRSHRIRRSVTRLHLHASTVADGVSMRHVTLAEPRVTGHRLGDGETCGDFVVEYLWAICRAPRPHAVLAGRGESAVPRRTQLSPSFWQRNERTRRHASCMERSRRFASVRSEKHMSQTKQSCTCCHARPLVAWLSSKRRSFAGLFDGRYWARISPLVELLGFTLLDFSRLLQDFHRPVDEGGSRLSTTGFDSALGQIRDMLEAVRSAAQSGADAPQDGEG